jgi:penicillin-insensitive murein endopeptidase
MTPRGLLGALLILAAAATVTDAGAVPPTYVRAGHVTTIARIPAGRSLGSPTDGRLVGGAHLEATPYLRIVPAYQAGDARWGLGSLVMLIDDAARAVHKQFPDAVTSVGHLSKQGGGDIDRHASHESGRDADIGFFIHSQTGRPLYSDHFVPFKGDATAPSWPGAYFDDARNWALVSALLADPHARITYIFVATPIRARLLAYAERVGASLAIRTRAAELMAQPRGSLPHDDHFHVRIGCPADSRGCIELPTVARSRHLTHGAAGHTHVAAGGSAHSPVPAPAATHAIPEANPPPAPLQPEVEDHDDPPNPEVTPDDAPPAVWSAPIDDVDGPLVPHHGKRAPLP